MKFSLRNFLDGRLPTGHFLYTLKANNQKLSEVLEAYLFDIKTHMT
jgi:hypothetical protein